MLAQIALGVKIALGVILLFSTQAFAGGLISLYGFNETDTTQPAADSSGNGLNGFYGGGTSLVPGVFGNAVQFDGMTSYVHIPYNTNFDSPSSTLSMEFWMNLDANNPGQSQVVSRGANNPWGVQLENVTNLSDPRGLSWIVNGVNLRTPAGLEPNVWQHVAIVQSGTNANVFLNGQLAAQGIVPTLPVASAAPPSDIFIGKRPNGYNMQGGMADVAIFKAVRTPDQIQSDMANGVPTNAPNLIALWRLDQTTTNSPCVDSSTNGLNGTYEGGVTLGAAGPLGANNAADFDGQTGFVLVPYSPIPDITTITIEFWVNWVGSSYNNYLMPLSRGSDSQHVNIPWTVQLNPTSGATSSRTVRWIPVNGGDSGNGVDAVNCLPPDGWHFVTITQDGTNAAVAQIYVDGNLITQGPGSPLPSPGGPDLYIGARSGLSSFYLGSVDDLGIFNVALSQSQIQSDMSNGVPVGPVTPEIAILADPISVTQQPSLQARFSVTAVLSGGNASLFGYQWQMNDADISGATNASYSTPALSTSDNGETFQCVVSYPGQTTVTTSAATLSVQSPKLVALWKFDETDTSQPAADSSGKGNDGSYAGSTSLVPGEFGNAVSLDGTSGYVNFPSSPDFDLTNMTLEFWLNVEGADTSYMFPASRGINNSPWSIQINPVSDPNAARSINWITQNQNGFGNANIITPGVWHHVAIIQHGLNAAIYVDGSRVASGVNSGLPSSSTQDIFVGKRADGYYFQGSIDDMALFNFPLALNQIQYQMQNGASATLVPAIPEIVITAQPQSVAVYLGDSATFVVAAGFTSGTNSNLSYQWQENGTNLAGATGASYSIPAVTMADSGAVFKCVVSASGATGATSSDATLTASPFALSIQSIASGISISWPTNLIGVQLQENPDAGDPAGWVNVADATNSPVDVNAPAGVMYYRLKK